MQNYIEYDYIQENEYLVAIEYCSNCEEHSTHTSHSADLYKNMATYIQKCIMMRFPFIKVLLKPIDTDIEFENHKSYEILKKTMIIDNKYKEVRIGAMEIQMCFKKPNASLNETVLLHSKLNSGNWPSITSVLNKIVFYVPLFSCEIKLFDKDFEVNEEESKTEEKDLANLIDNNLQNIKLNVYKLKNKNIEDLANCSKYELENINDPKKRKQMILSARRKEKELSINLKKDLSNRNFGLTKPSSTSMSKFLLEKTAKLENVTRQETTNSKLFTKSLQLFKDSNEITDKETINSYKGDLIRTLYSSKEAKVNILDLPYDTYLIEVDESSNFQNSAIIISFKHIQKEKNIHKFIGLNKQLNTYIQIFVYKMNKESNNEELISDANVVMSMIGYPSTNEKIIYDEQEHRLKINESKSIKGRYDTILVPGKYSLEVSKTGYGTVKKQIKLDSGEKKINIEMSSEKNFKLRVNVINYDKFTSVENAHIRVCLGNSDVILDGISNSEGICDFDSNIKDQFLTILVDKQGFFNSQRTCIRDFNESEKKPREVNVILVRESFILKENCIMIITYSNLIEENFEPQFQYSDAIGQFTDISCADSQSENGALISFFKYHEPKLDEKEELKAERYEDELEEIIKVSLTIKTKKLKKTFQFDESNTMNGLQRYSCECCIYTPNNIFYIQPPAFSKESTYEFWDIGFLDIKNCIFYEIGLLNEIQYERTIFFFEWINFLQLLIDTKTYTKLFELFEFDKGLYSQNDRFIHEPMFLSSIRKITNDEMDGNFTTFMCDLFKSHNKMISFSLFKKKISSNLKNFKDNLKLTFSNSSGAKFIINK